MRKRFTNTIILQQDEIMTLIDSVEDTISGDILPSLNTLIKEVGDQTILSNSLPFAQLCLKDDKEFFEKLIKIEESYLKIIPMLKKKVLSEVSDTISTSTYNLNNKILLAVLSEGIYFSEIITDVLTYIVDKFYTEESSELDTSIKAKAGNDLLTLVKLIPEFEKSNLDKVVETIGNIPTIKTLRNEEMSVIPTDVIMGFFKDTFKISDFYTQATIKRFLGFFNYKDENKHHSELSRSFIGNPIMHIRLLLVDIDMLRADYHKARVKLLELRLLELKSNSGNLKAIKYYEDKVNKLKLKVTKILEVK